MEATSGHAWARTTDCRIAGCAEEAPALDRFAGYCDLHRPTQNGKPIAAVERAAGTYAARAEALIAVGRELDEAFAVYKPARAALTEAMKACRFIVPCAQRRWVISQSPERRGGAIGQRPRLARAKHG